MLRLVAGVETRLASVLDWVSSKLLPPLLLPRSPSEEASLLVLRQIRAENRFFTSVALAASVCLLAVPVNLTDGSREPWSLILGGALTVLLSLNGYRVLWRRRRRFLRQHAEAVQAAVDAKGADGEPAETARLRSALMSSAEAARDALRRVNPDALTEVTRGETRALALLAWLADAERLAHGLRIDRELRRRTVERLADSSSGSAPGPATDRQPFENLLRELDGHERRLGTLEQRLRNRLGRVESFLLALEGVRSAADAGADPAAVTAPLLERVALLEESASSVDSVAAARAETATAARRFREEVRLAQDLQRSILPAAAPQLPGLTVAHVYRPSNEVGGDFYDFYDLGDGRLMVAIGDASGHGIDSSMVSSMAKSAVYMQIATGGGVRGGGLAGAMAQINDMMCDTLGRRRLMTLSLLVIDTGNGQIEWINAGHVYPLLRRGGQVSELEQPGYPLGIKRGISYQVRAETLEPGDLLLLLTDGYVEALDPAGEPLGWEPLAERLRTTGAADVEAVLAEITGDLDDHLQGSSPQDDVTLIALAYRP